MTAPVLGVVPDMPDDEYRRHPALSQSGAKLLLPPNCPAIYRWQMDNPPDSKPHFDLGHAAHKAVLGQGAPIRYIQGKTAKGDPSDGWGSKYAQEQQAEAYAAGEIPLLESQRGIIEGMAEALRAHPLASRLLDPADGKPEISLFWTDEETGVNLRGRLDWLPNPRDGRLLLCDFKTTISANPEQFAKSVVNYGYHQQDSHYTDGVRALGLDDDPAFLFILMEKTPPYLVTVVELDADAKTIGRQLNRQAIDIYRMCLETDTWPGYSDDVERVALPYWYQRQFNIGEPTW